MNKIDFMNFFRDDECLNSLSVKDRVEIFMSILPSGSDITVDRLNELLSDYSVDGCIVVGDKKPDAKYRLSEGMIHVIGSHGVKVNDKIEAEEMFEYAIIDRLDFVYQLIGWIAHAEGNDLALMTADLELLMGLQDDYIFSSISTNDYIYGKCDNFNETCEELLRLNDTINGINRGIDVDK